MMTIFWTVIATLVGVVITVAVIVYFAHQHVKRYGRKIRLNECNTLSFDYCINYPHSCKFDFGTPDGRFLLRFAKARFDRFLSLAVEVDLALVPEGKVRFIREALQSSGAEFLKALSRNTLRATLPLEPKTMERLIQTVFCEALEFEPNASIRVRFPAKDEHK